MERGVGAFVHTQQQHLDLVSLGHLVPLELILDLIVPCLSGCIFLARAATHLNDQSTTRRYARDATAGSSGAQTTGLNQ